MQQSVGENGRVTTSDLARSPSRPERGRDDGRRFHLPEVGTRGLVAGDSYVGHGLTVGGVEIEHYFDSIMTAPFNAMSRCPVLAVPSGIAENGVPTGIQIVGRTYDDESVFRVGAALEQVQPWFDTPERRPAL